MTITQIVLGSLNIIAAGVMLWFAAQAAYARAAWVNHMRQYEEMRDGLNTGKWINTLTPDQLQLLKARVNINEGAFWALSPEDRTRLVNALKGAVEEADLVKPVSEEDIRQEIGRLFWNTGQRTQMGKRGDAKEYTVVEDARANPPQKLFSDDADIQNLAKRLGPRGFTKLVRAAIEQQYPKLDLDLREAASRLYFARGRLADAEAQQKRIKADVDLLVTRRDVERQLLTQAEAENLERRREITRLQADVEEAFGAYTVALGRELDRQRLLADLQQKQQQALQASGQLVEQIQKRETGGTPPGGNP
jgi:hypothetical protein